MYSRLDPIFRALPRRTESTDTHLGIHREEKQDDRKRKDGHGKDEEDSALWDDSTVVSVRALKVFLSGMLGTSVDANNEKIDIDDDPGDGSVAQTRAPSSPQAARAMQAYGGRSRAVEPPQHPNSAMQSAESSLKLSAEEERVIHRLVADLDVLAGRGVTDLNIRRNKSFLQSLVDAVAEAL